MEHHPESKGCGRCIAGRREEKKENRNWNPEREHSRFSKYTRKKIV